MQVWTRPHAEHDKGHKWLPPGFRFHPTDEELVIFYLAKKIQSPALTDHAISEADLNKCEPWELPGRAKMGEKEWYFYSLRDRKYPTGMRTNRATDAGYWKATGKDREVLSSRISSVVGWKKTLVFYRGRAPKGEKTNWVMHEYRMEGTQSFQHLPRSSKDEWVVCRIFQKGASGKKTLFENRRMPSCLDKLSSLPPLLESHHLLHDHQEGMREVESAAISFRNTADSHHQLMAIKHMDELLDHCNVETKASEELPKCSPSGCFDHKVWSINSRIPVSGSVGVDLIKFQPAISHHAAPSSNMPSNAALKVLLQHYSEDASAKRITKTEPIDSVLEEATEFHSTFSEADLILLAGRQQLNNVVNPLLQVLANDGGRSLSQPVSSQPQVNPTFSSDICEETNSAVSFNRLGRSPSNNSSSLDLESFWDY